MKRRESIEIDAPVGDVWNLAHLRFEDIGHWSSGVSRSTVLSGESPFRVAGRVCDTPQGETIETLTGVDNQAHRLTYEVTGPALPSFVKRATNTWEVEALSARRSRLSMTVEMTTGGFLGALMKPMMSMGMGRVLRINLQDLKHFIETGQHHPRKRPSDRRS